MTTTTGEDTQVRSWTIELPLTKPLSMNDREHWRAKARMVAYVRRITCNLAQQQRIPRCDRIAVELHYAPRDARRRDAINLAATLKPCEDGLVDAGVVPDDTAEYVEPTMPRIDPPTGKGNLGRLYLIVRDLGPAR